MRFAIDSSVRARSCRPADVTPELLGQEPPAQRRPHTRQAADLLAKATNGLAITRRHAATGVAVQWALLGIGSRLGAEGCPYAGSTRRVGLAAWAMNLAF